MAETSTKTTPKIVANLKKVPGAIKAFPGNFKKDVKSVSTGTKIAVGTGTVGIAALSFLAGRATKKAPKAKVTPTATAK